jgi:hypothetical protein
LPLNASCWVFDPTAQPAQACLFVRLRGALAAVEAACPRLVADVQAAGGSVTRLDNAQAGPDWAACREQTPAIFPGSRAELCLMAAVGTANARRLLDLPYPVFVEWHGAQRWLWRTIERRTAPAGGRRRRRRSRHPVPNRSQAHAEARPGCGRIHALAGCAGAHPAARCCASLTLMACSTPGAFSPTPPPPEPAMQTHLAPEFRSSADGLAAEAILRKVCALRVLHCHLPHLPAAGRRARRPARPHLT